MIKEKRKPYIDGLKCLAIFIIFLTHFVAYFESDYIRFWSEPPMSFLMKGMTGKYGVAILAVCLGYFAYESREENASVYMARRYFYFFISGLFINTVIAALSYAHIILFDNGLPARSLIVTSKAVLKESLILGYRIYPTYWCMFDFCVGSVFAYLNGRDKVKTLGILVQMLLFWLSGRIWVTICLIGCLCRRFLKNRTCVKILSIKPIRFVLLLLSIVLAIEEGGDAPNLWNGIRAMMIVLVLEESPLLQKVLSSRPFALTGKNVLGVFLIHMPVLIIFGGWLFKITSGMRYLPAFVISLMVSWCITAALTYPISWLLNAVLDQFTKLLKKTLPFFNQPTSIQAGSTEWEQ